MRELIVSQLHGARSLKPPPVQTCGSNDSIPHLPFSLPKFDVSDVSSQYHSTPSKNSIKICKHINLSLQPDHDSRFVEISTNIQSEDSFLETDIQ